MSDRRELDASSVFYMDKIVTGPEGIGVVDIRKPIGENIRALAKAKGKSVGDMTIAVLDRPRHEQLIDDIREAGAGTRLISDGDVAGGINAVRDQPASTCASESAGALRASSRRARSRRSVVSCRATLAEGRR